MRGVFENDWNPMMGDSFPFTSDHYKWGEANEQYQPSKRIPSGMYEPTFKAQTFTGQFECYPLILPDIAMWEDVWEYAWKKGYGADLPVYLPDISDMPNGSILK